MAKDANPLQPPIMIEAYSGIPLCEYLNCGHFMNEHNVDGFGDNYILHGSCSLCNCPGFMRNGRIAMGS